MPSLPWSKSNRSQASLGSSTDQNAALAHEAALQQQRYRQAEEQQQRYSNQSQGPIGRSTSHRHSTNLSLDRPPINVAASVNAAEITSPSSERPPDQRYSYNPQGQEHTHEKRSIRSRLGLGHHSHSTRESSSNLGTGSANASGLARTVSLRKKVTDGARYPNQDQPQSQQQWPARRSSAQPLTTSNEADEDVDPFLQRPEDHSPNSQQPPVVPAKDFPHQAYQQESHPSQFQRPTIARVDTDHSHHTQTTTDHYSPEHIGQQPPQYIAYHQQQLQTPSNANYQAFIPQGQPVSPNTATLPQSQHPGDANNRTDYSYQQQHQQQQDLNQYIQQGRPPSQQQKDSQHPQSARPPSAQQQYPELQHPQATRLPVQQQILQDQQHLQINRPPSQQQFVPPSPQTESYQAYDPQGQSQPHNDPNQGAQQQLGNSMPAAQRRLGDGKTASMPPSQQQRQSQQQVPPGMQQGQGSQTPGLTTFNSNVVPPGAQGQPYRGQQGQDQQSIQQEGDTGRATPPPARSISDMTEEDANAYTQMQKDYKELREKYQKVKKYYFEKESQVHALQNTIAHSRLAASRTSLDDSEYAQRFLRLHGLIQNLSFGIRKDWKTIPILLQPAVNKDATTVGKQEMTCVGRSYIASWLVDELFDKYFHPDLEVGLSTQLKLIQQNIRKFAPPFQSGEEEESLASKIISWRLSTLEGLQESLRSPQAAANRERLVEILIEKLTASLQMHLQVPPPRELDAGVPMIVELAVKLAVNLPLESRDVLIEYFPPGHPILPDVMSIESGVPPLTNPHDDADRASLVSTASDLKESPSEREGGETPVSAGGNVANSKDQDKSRRGMFGNFMGSKKTGPPSTQQKQAAGAGGSQVSLTQGQQPPGSSNGPKEDQQPPRVRMAAGLAIQIRGKSVLVKAPVYSTV